MYIFLLDINYFIQKVLLYMLLSLYKNSVNRFFVEHKMLVCTNVHASDIGLAINTVLVCISGQ